ncbi:MAG: serine/threonine protein phosphatase [Candidatus Omnitrophica bacterium]|nr:serine/threonine protein phosphatase [Candidatus Omnitrophota bacterium]MCM8829059.1 serine/threonine protein phosphatase [Candidatus Omnitrophota bacterium]
MKKVIQLPDAGKAVIVGDTHGDLQASRSIIKQYGKRKYYVIFLGDYVDRGEKSRENIDFLLNAKKENSRIILLAGNHEMNAVEPVSPSNFWEQLNQEDVLMYSEIFQDFPLAASGNGFVATHAGLPDLPDIEEWNKIEPGDENWIKLLWADFRDKDGEYLGSLLGRIKLGRDYFTRVMNAIGKNVLIRSHDPYAPEKMFNNRCLTIFTSASYGKGRKIAIVDLSREIDSVEKIELISL